MKEEFFLNIVVVSYSLTGNNRALANRVAGKLSAMHIALTEPKKRGMGRIIADMLFGLTPKVQPAPATAAYIARMSALTAFDRSRQIDAELVAA